MMGDRTTLANALEDAATATRTLGAVIDYAGHPPTDGRYGVQVDWTWGTSANKDGYLAIRKLVAAEIERQMPGLIMQAVVDLKSKADAARHEAAHALTKATEP